MGVLFTPAQNVSNSQSGYFLGFLDVNARYTFRGRRLDDPIFPSLGHAQSSQPKEIIQATSTEEVKSERKPMADQP